MEGKSRRSETVNAKNKREPANGVNKASKKSKKYGRLPSVPASGDTEGLIDRVTGRKSKSKSSEKLAVGPGAFLLHLPLQMLSRSQASGNACASYNRPACRLLIAPLSQLVASSGSAPNPGGNLSVPIVSSATE